VSLVISFQYLPVGSFDKVGYGLNDIVQFDGSGEFLHGRFVEIMPGLFRWFLSDPMELWMIPSSRFHHGIFKSPAEF